MVEKIEEESIEADYSRHGDFEVFVVVFIFEFVLFTREGDIHRTKNYS